MQRARACRAGQALAVCGDYDADEPAPCWSSSQPFRCEPPGSDSQPAKRGPGLNAAGEQLAEQGVKLLVTVDNGISARSLGTAGALGLEVIVTDHHIPPQRPPLALLHRARTAQPCRAWRRGSGLRLGCRG